MVWCLWWCLLTSRCREHWHLHRFRSGFQNILHRGWSMWLWSGYQCIHYHFCQLLGVCKVPPWWGEGQILLLFQVISIRVLCACPHDCCRDSVWLQPARHRGHSCDLYDRCYPSQEGIVRNLLQCRTFQRQPCGTGGDRRLPRSSRIRRRRLVKFGMYFRSRCTGS